MDRMSYLKSCIEASNALKNATDETVSSCFIQIVHEIFGGERNLLQLLLSPQSNLKRQQMEQIKQIFHTKFQEIIDTELDTDAMCFEQESLAPTLTNIAEPTQILITSFLDFQSINQLKNVCPSIAPICITQLLNTMDIKILNIHQLMRNHMINNDKIKMNDIIQSSLQTHRVHRAHTLKSFVQTETSISFDNLLCFKHPMGTRRPMLEVNAMTTMRDLNASELLFMDKSLLPQSVSHHQIHRTHHSPMIFVQEFDIKHQSLKVTDVVRPFANQPTFADIKEMIVDRIHQDVTLYQINHTGDVEEIVGISAIIRRRGGIMTVFYERNINRNISQSEKEALKLSNYKKLKPFSESLYDFYRLNASSIPGFKYNQLALDLRNNYEDAVSCEDILKCFKKAYDLSPDHPTFIFNYIDALVELGDGEEDLETAHQLCLQKLKLRDTLPNLIRMQLYCLMGRICEWREESTNASAIEYYQKAVQLIQSELDRRENVPFDLFTQFINPDPYFRPTEYLQRGLCETYYNIACLYEEAIELEQDKTASIVKAEEYYLKILEIQPDSASHRARYAKYLQKYKMEYSDAIEQYMVAEQLMNDSGEGDGAFSLFCCYEGWYNCLMELKRYNEAETLCLKWIERAQKDDNDNGWYLHRAYDKIICLYKEHLKQPEAAKMYSSKLKSSK